MQQAVLKIEGMTCQGCVRSVKKALERMAGVQSVEVSLEKGQAQVVFDPARADLGKLKATVEEAGYQVA